MTEGSRRGELRPGAVDGAAGRRSARPTRTGTRHPLLGVFPLAVMTLSVFLVTFTLLMARLSSQPGGALPTGGGAARLLAGGSGGAVRTRVSGAGATPAGAGAASAPRAAATAGTPAIVTRSSGAAREGAVEDG